MSQKKHNRRKRYFVDSEVQPALMRQCAIHWGLFGLAAFILLFLTQWLVTPEKHSFAWHVTGLWTRYGMILMILLALMPVFVFDMLKLTNRFCGPLVQLRRAMRALARGEDVKPVRFRKGDYWTELADEFNAMLKQIQQQQSSPSHRLEDVLPPECGQDQADENSQPEEKELAAADH